MAFVPSLPSTSLISTNSTFLSPSSRPATLSRPCPRPTLRPITSTAASPPKAPSPRVALAKRFVADAGSLGTLRFVAVGNGAVLETIGRFDYGVTDFSIPGKGDYITVASVDKTFECHLCLSNVAKITMTDDPAMADKTQTLHVIRFRDAEDKVMLSVLLMWAPNEGPGNYLFGAVDAFNELREKYGAEFALP